MVVLLLTARYAASNEEYTSLSVSYTHLDVYKRQIAKGKGNAEAEKSRRKLERLFANIPAWKVGDPAIPMCILPEFPLLQTPKNISLEQILHSY